MNESSHSRNCYKMLLISCLVGLGFLFVVDANTWDKESVQGPDDNLHPLDRTKRLHQSTPPLHPWPKAIMPYVIEDAALPQKSEYMKVIALYEANSCVRMPYWNESTPHTYGLTHKSYMKLIKSGGCYSTHMGVASGPIAVSCCAYYHCVHEMGHTLGFSHEQGNPLRDGWMRTNWNDIWPSNRNTYKKDTETSWELAQQHDITSPLHYLPWMYGVRTGSVHVLFPELQFNWELFYYMGEVAELYECSSFPPCHGKNLNCDNDGYQTIVRGKCACVCPTGLDPDNACKTPLRKVTSASWPKGQYALPKPVTGCPNGGSFQDGQLVHSGAEGNSMSNDNHMMGEVKGSHAELNFCTRTIADDVFDTEDAAKFNWPIGNYCFYMKGDTCPTGFGTHSIEYTVSSVTTTGQVPSGNYDKTTVEMKICCQYQGFPEEPTSFPTDKPFALIKLGSSCQAVTGMRSASESFTIRSLDRIKTTLNGWLRKDGMSVLVPVCHYWPLDMDCGGSITLSKTNPVATIEMNIKNRAHLECTWIIRGDNNESTIVLDFEDFKVEKGNKDCIDRVEVRHARIGQFGLKYCGEKPDHSIRSITDKLLVRFFAKGNSESFFKAIVRLTEYADMCYDLEDKRGASYDGSVNYTRTFKPCLPWAQMSECYHHPYLEKDMFASLDGNACRNPDNSFRPWCYTDKNECQRDYCDVCGIEVPHDKVDHCDELKDRGFCTTDASLAAQQCSKTCFDQLPSSKTSLKKYTEITCGQPTPPSDGDIVGKIKSSYTLGETVQYKCNRGPSVVTSRCMTSRQWSEVGSACLECPNDFTLVDNTCYGLMDKGKKATFDNAVAMCKSIGGDIATPKSQKIATMLMVVASAKISWIGIDDRDVEGKWVYEDGSELIWTSWDKYEPNNRGNEDCAVSKANTQWMDVSCSSSYAVTCEIPALELACIDVHAKCQGLLTDRPTLCEDKPEFARKYCRRTCHVCPDEDAKCSVQNPSPNVLTVTTQQSISVAESVNYDCVRFTYPTKGDKHQACLPGGVLSGEPLKCEECPLGFKMVNNACHGLLEGRMLSFNDAQLECRKIDGYVAMPKSQMENDAIRSLGLGGNTWLGLTDLKHEGKFVWEDRSPLGWENWAAGEPKANGDSLDCTIMNGDKQWINVNCKDYKLATVCTLPKSGSTICYDRRDNGVTYNGKAHVTIYNHECSYWKDKGHCSSKGPFNRGMERSNLDANYCRNPDGEKAPWCYTDGCSWALCDVCDRSSQPDYDIRDKGKTYTGTAHVTVNGDVCGNWADKKKCNVNPVSTKYSGLNFEKNYCRNYDNSASPWCYTTGCEWALCDMSLASPLVSTNIVDVTCSPPSIPSDGEMVSNPRSSYKLGEEVTFKCRRNKFLVTTTCLTSGDWTPVGMACTECPIGYYPFNDTCYIFVDKMLANDMAVKECSKIGGHLPRPKTIQENDFIQNMGKGKYIWIDAKKFPDDNYKTYKWSDGTTANWLKGKQGSSICSFIKPDGEWGSTACDFIQPNQMFACAVPKLDNTECKDFLENQCTQLLGEKPSMCQDHAEFARQFCSKTCGVCGDGRCKLPPTDRMSEVLSEATTITTGHYVEFRCKKGFFQSDGNTQRACLPNGQLTGSDIKCQSCPPGYVEHNHLCYGFVDKAMTFNDAAKECSKINGYLASPKHEAENDFIDSVRRGFNVWIGASDQKMKGDFRWHDGTKVEWSNWNAGEPNHAQASEDCVQMYTGKMWFDMPCNAHSRFVCTTPILGDESCYDNADKGATYAGKVNITDASQPCTDWATATKCPHNPFVKGDEQKNLVENYCRNPDDSSGPWCYIDANTCDKKYCSVCEHEQDADYTKVKCEAPSPPSDGVSLNEQVKTQYKVGESVELVCARKESLAAVTTTCLTDGQWSPIGMACTECPMGYEPFNDQCYWFTNKRLNFNQARKYCHDTVDGVIASPNSTAENDFVNSLSQRKDVWIGANDIESEGTWVWDDGSKLTWSNWEAGEPNNWNGGEDAAVMKGSNKEWNDIGAWNKIWLVCATKREDISKTQCEDLLMSQCPLILSKNAAMCHEYKSFASQFCPKTCGLCLSSSSIECDVPASSSSVSTDTKTSTVHVGDSITFSCSNNSFYPLAGDRVRACLPAGTLSGTPMQCQDVLQAPQVSIGPAEDLTSGDKETPPFVAFVGTGDQYSIENKGKIVAWEYFSASSLETAFQVWRPTGKDDEFQLIGQNVVTTGNKGQERHDIPVDERIDVEAGDYIGIFNGGKGGVRFFSCDSDSHPEWNDYFAWTKQTSVHVFKVGANVSFKSNTVCVLFQFKAIVAILE